MLRGEVRMQTLQNVQHLLGHHSPIHQGNDGRAGIITLANYNADPVSRLRLEIARIFERFVHRPQHQEVIRLAAYYGVRHDAVLQRVKREGVGHPTAFFTVDAVLSGRIWVVKHLRIPAFRRNVADRVYFVDDVLPELVWHCALPGRYTQCR